MWNRKKNLILSGAFREAFPGHLGWALKDELDFPRLEGKKAFYAEKEHNVCGPTAHILSLTAFGIL